ncbi:glutamate dehydrogenase [Salegentibacter sp. F188]|uniref:Glutamate dehydrogenase n=1 Tax=Autumnicola patrickiae TaxID=3075591 RepID=A0ABU3E1D9_9FLAO|nr:glutamate dehydrogenase [Salegentibacter sp. F188]MDT0689740.1 glutamate dehydrogenase [Salegentibacter sp. F188]
MLRTVFFLFIFFLVFGGKSYSQFGFTHEIGVLVGPSSFFTDYGERWNLKNNINNSGLGVGIVHYINFAFDSDCNYRVQNSYFNKHFRVRSEFDYLRSNLEHHGPVASQNTVGGQLLRAMHGFSETYEMGMHLEYHPVNIRDFANFGYLFSPYVSLGAHLVHFRPRAYSDLGPLDDPANVFPTFEGGIELEPKNTFAVIGSMGVRYKIHRTGDFLIEGKWHYYNSDWIDGLNIDAPQNKANDWVFWVGMGYVQQLNFN